jgi:hypothetical protein
VRTAAFIVGPPGAGKTTIVRQLLNSLNRSEWNVGLVQSPRWTMASRRDDQAAIFAAGWYDGRPFEGADTVAYNGVVQALDFWKHSLTPSFPRSLTIFDGDRFSHAGALGTVRASVDKCVCVYLHPPVATLSQRRQAREQQVGKSQNSVWASGRATKAARFAALFDDGLVLRIDQVLTPEQSWQQVSGFVGAQNY